MYKHEKYVKELMGEIEKGMNNPSFYLPKIRRFFTEYMGQNMLKEKPIGDITSFDINNFLASKVEISNNYNNYYHALQKFFHYTYINNITKDVFKEVPKQKQKRKSVVYLDDMEWQKIKMYINDEKADIIQNRLLIALFFYTGMSRMHISQLTFGSFDLERNLVQIAKDTVQVPVDEFLIKIIREYKNSMPSYLPKQHSKLIEINENYISDKVSRICKKVVDKKITPTIISNTFIKKSLEVTGNDVSLISAYLMENPSTIANHIQPKDDKSVFESQQNMLAKLF